MFETLYYTLQPDNKVNVYKLNQFSINKLVSIDLIENDIEEQISDYLYSNKTIKKEIIIILIKL